MKKPFNSNADGEKPKKPKKPARKKPAAKRKLTPVVHQKDKTVVIRKLFTESELTKILTLHLLFEHEIDYVGKLSSHVLAVARKDKKTDLNKLSQVRVEVILKKEGIKKRKQNPTDFIVGDLFGLDDFDPKDPRAEDDEEEDDKKDEKNDDGNIS